MTFINIDANDRRWLAGWLRSNLICVLVALCLLAAVRVESTVPVIRMPQMSAQSTTAIADRHAQGFSVVPQGWRRTVNGWEYASGWQQFSSSRPLAELVSIQQAREPAWIQNGMRWLRELSPLTFAVLQLLAITAIVWSAEIRKKRPAEISASALMKD